MKTYVAGVGKQLAALHPPKVVSTTIDGRLGVRTRPTTDNGGLHRVTGRQLANALGWNYSAFRNAVLNGLFPEKPVEKFDRKDPNALSGNFCFERADAEAICRRAGKSLPI